MAFLTIAGIAVPVAQDGFKRLPVEVGGSQSRAYAGNLRSTERWQKYAWSVTTGLMKTADTTTLETAIANGAVVSCSGDALNNVATNCVVTMSDKTAAPAISNDGFKHMWALTLTLRQV